MTFCPSDHFFAPLEQGKYRAICIDYPWKFSGGTKGRPQHYPRMTDAEIVATIPSLASLAHPDGCFLFFWISPPMFERFWMRYAPALRRVGFRYSSRGLMWGKLRPADGVEGEPLFFMRDQLAMLHGYTTRKGSEDLLLFRRGRPKRQSAKVRELLLAPIREHSRKPDEALERIEEFCAGPYAEIFSRTSRPKWDCWGDEAGKFDAAENAA